MKIPEEKKPEMAPKDVGSNMCAVAMCTETAKRNLIKHKFEASVCPYHYRFVYALPYIHRCQYLKSVVDEVVLGAYVLHFQPGNSWPTAQLLPGSNTHSDAKPADDLVCCDNRATRVVLVGDKLNHCKVYLFCHGHNAQVRTQACGFDAKPSTAKNEPYMSGAPRPVKAACPSGALCTTKMDDDGTRIEPSQPFQLSSIEGSTSGESANSSVSDPAIVTSTARDPKGKGVAHSKTVTVKHDPVSTNLDKYRHSLKELAALLHDLPQAEKLLQLEQRIGRELTAASGQSLSDTRRAYLSELAMDAEKVLDVQIVEGEPTVQITPLKQESLDKIAMAHRKKANGRSMWEDHVYDRLPPLVPVGTTRFDTREDRKIEETIRYYICTWNAVVALYDRLPWPIRWLVLPPILKVGAIVLSLLRDWLLV